MKFRRIEDNEEVYIKNPAHATGYYTAIDNRGRKIWEVEDFYAEKLAELRDNDEALRTFAGRQYNTEITDEAIIGMLCEKEVMEDERAEQKIRDAERMTREKKDEEAKRAKIKAELLAEIEAEKAKEAKKAEEAKKTAAKTNKK